LSGLVAATVATEGTGPGAAAYGFVGTLSVDDIYGPSFVSANYSDTNNDGAVDTLSITFNEAIGTNTASIGDFTYVANDITSSALSGGSNNGETATIITLTLGTNGDAGITSHATAPTLAYTFSSGALQDSSGNQAGNFTAQNLADGAAPVISSFEYQDNDSDGKVDTVRFNMSETLDAASVMSANDLVFGNVGDFTGAVFGADGTDQAGASGVVDITLGTEATVVDTVDNSGNFAITTQNGFSLSDGTNTNTTLGTQTQATTLDGAAPVLISSSPEDADVSVITTADVVLTFSEPMNTGTFAYSCCGAGTDPGQTPAWTVSDTVVTLSPDAPWLSSEDITITITTADDVNVNGFGGVVAGMNNPFTFTIAAAQSGGTPTPGTGPAAVVTSATLMSPNGGEILQGNSVHEITWSASGDNLSTISLHYSTDNGRTYELIALDEPNDGSYSWTVPNETVVTGKIRVDAVTSSGGVLIDDSSNASFSITSIIVVPEPEIVEPEQTGPVLAEMMTPEGIVVDIREGTLFRGVELSGVYQVVDGTRYVFPNEETFLSYFADFSGVQQVGDDQLRKIPFGGRMIMNVGQLIKIQSDNRVYVVQEGEVLQHIPDESTAISTYGADWAQLVHDISVVFWFDYTHS